MKKISKIFFGVVLGAMGLASCSSDETELVQKVDGKYSMTFEATAEGYNGIGTRTALNGTSVVWSENDHFSVFDTSTANNQFTIVQGAGSGHGKFSGNVSNAESGWYILYPYTDARISGSTISGVELPTEQKAVKNGFDPAVSLLTGYTDKSTIAFKQVVCYIEITTTEACKEISFESNGTENIAGTLSLTVANTGIATYNVTSGSKKVKLVPSEGDTFEAGTYHLAILPQTLANGFTMECVTAEDSKLARTHYGTTADQFARGSIKDFGTVSTPAWTGPKDPREVDLGLPSKLKWASMNVGAESPEQYGDYFAWGATEPFYTVRPTADGTLTLKSDKTGGYTWANTPYNTSGDDSEWSKYTASLDSYSSTGTADGKTVLESADDAATHQWGSDWRMPTTEEYAELTRNTYWVWTDNYNSTGVKGYIVYAAKDASHKGKKLYGDGTGDNFTAQYSLSDAHIFFPAAGYCSARRLSSSTSNGYYWSASVNTSIPYDSNYLIFNSARVTQYGNFRSYGFPVRPVRAN